MGDVRIGLAIIKFWWWENHFSNPGNHTGRDCLCHLFDNLAKREERTNASHWGVWSIGPMQRLTLQRCFLEHLSTDGILYLLGCGQWYRRVVLLPWVYSNTESRFKQALYCFGAFFDAPMLTDCINISRFNPGIVHLHLTDLSNRTFENPVSWIPPICGNHFG